MVCTYDVGDVNFDIRLFIARYSALNLSEQSAFLQLGPLSVRFNQCTEHSLLNIVSVIQFTHV